MDRKAPAVNCEAADDLWHKDDVSIDCVASDGGSGLDGADSSFTLSTSVAASTETPNAETNSRQVFDAVGNSSTSGPVGGNKVDKKVPGITVAEPSDGAEYEFNAEVAASYECADGGSGVDSCAGPVESGSNIDTASVGSKTFTVEASDAAGNTSSLAHGYSVSDNVPPQVSIDSGPEGPTNDDKPTFGFGGSDNITAATDLVYSYRLDEGEWSTYSEQTSVTLGGEAGLSQGGHTFYVKARDEAGRESNPAQRSFAVETVEPTISGLSPRPGSAIRDTTPTIKATIKDNMTNLMEANIKLYVKGDQVSAKKFRYSAATDKLLYKSRKLDKGKKSVKIAAEDAAGNVSVKSWRFRIK